MKSLSLWDAFIDDHPRDGLGSLKSRGLYAEQLSRFLKFFPSQQIFIASVADIQSEPDFVLESLLHFLNVETEFNSSLARQIIKPEDTLPWLRQLYQQTSSIDVNYSEKELEKITHWYAPHMKKFHQLMDQLSEGI